MVDQNAIEKVSRVQEALERADLDCVILASQANVYYVSGVDVVTSRLMVDKTTFVVIPQDAPATIVVCDWDDDAAREATPIEDVRSYSGTEGIRTVITLLKEYGLERSRIGIEDKYMRAADYRLLLSELPAAHFSSCEMLMQKLRAIKSADEIKILRHAARQTEKAIYATFTTTKPGDSEQKMANKLIGFLREFGAIPQLVPLLTAGHNTTILHLLPSEKEIAEGEIIHVDVGGTFTGYWSDISRNAVVSVPNTMQKANYARLWEIHQELMECMKVGTRVSDLYRHYQELFARHGFPGPLSTLGHSMGLENHEWPELDLNHDVELQNGMVFALEPTVLIPGDARYDIEDLVLVTDHGPELLSSWRSTEEMFVIE